MPVQCLAETRRGLFSLLASAPLPHLTLCCCACCHAEQVGNDEVDAEDQQQQNQQQQPQQQNHEQPQQQQQAGHGGEGDGGQMGGLSAAELAHILWDQASPRQLLLQRCYCIGYC